MEITFVRHAQPAWDIDGIAQHDPPLTDLGVEQAKLAAARLSDRPADELIVSPAVRSRQTAEPIAAALGLTPQVVPGLVEISWPDYSGTPSEAVADAFRTAYRRDPDEWWDGMPGGESFRDFHARVAEALAAVLAERGVEPRRGDFDGMLWNIGEARRSIVVVAHAGTNAVALGILLGLEPMPWEWERFVLGHASLARVRTFPIGPAHIFSMRSFNDVEHLARDQRTR